MNEVKGKVEEKDKQTETEEKNGTEKSSRKILLGLIIVGVFQY